MKSEMSYKMGLIQLYETHVERPFGKAGERRLSDEEIIGVAKRWRGEGKVWERCVEYLERYPRLTYIKGSDFEDIYGKILSNQGSRVLEVGCFLGNEIRQFHNDGFKGYVAGVDINPWHHLVGFLVHNDSPKHYENVEFLVGDVCKMSTVPSNNFDYVYSNGLIHSLEKRMLVPVHLREARRVLKKSGLMFGNTLLKDDIHSDSLIRLTKLELLREFAAAGLEISFIGEGESPVKGKLLYYRLTKV